MDKEWPLDMHCDQNDLVARVGREVKRRWTRQCPKLTWPNFLSSHYLLPVSTAAAHDE